MVENTSSSLLKEMTPVVIIVSTSLSELSTLLRRKKVGFIIQLIIIISINY